MQTLQEISWEKILNRPDINGGELRTQESNGTFRGPIESAVLTGDGRILFRLLWVQSRNLIGDWEDVQLPSNTYQVNVDRSPPRLSDPGLIMFDLPGGGIGTILPRR